MRKTKQIAILIWTICAFIYNVWIKHVEYFNVNANVLFFASTFGLIAVFIFAEWHNAYHNTEREFYFILMIYPAAFVVLNLITIGSDYEFHALMTVNPYIDWALGAFIALALFNLFLKQNR